MTVPSSAPDNDWDERNAVEIRRYASAADIDHSASEAYEFIVPARSGGPLDITALYAPRPSRTLIVSFHGSLQRSKFQLPRFEWRKTLAPFEAAQLFVADSTLHLNRAMALSWYVGNFEQDFTSDVASLIREVATAAGYDRILLTGSSGGGFASLAISRKIDGSVAVCFSPQTRVGDYHGSVVDKFRGVAFGEAPSYAQAEIEHRRVSTFDTSMRRRPTSTTCGTSRTPGTRTTTSSITCPSLRPWGLPQLSVAAMRLGASNWCHSASSQDTNLLPEDDSDHIS